MKECLLALALLCGHPGKTDWMLVGLHGATVGFDGYSTRQFVRQGYIEVGAARPLLGPRPTWNRMAPLGALEVWSVAKLPRKYRWPVQLGLIGLHIGFGAHNLTLRPCCARFRPGERHR